MWLWVAVAMASKLEGIQKLVDEGKVEEAQKKCEKSAAWLPENEPELRELCAEAMWSKYVAEDTFAGWVRFQTDWDGTQKAKAGFEMEAKAQLRDLGEKATEVAYAGFLKKYGETAVAVEARKRQAAVALGSVQSADDAKRVAREYPAADGLVEVVRTYFDAFVKLDIDDETVVPVLEPDVRLPGALLEAKWAVRRPNGLQPWDPAAIGHLDEMKVPRETTTELARGQDGKLGYPPCSLAGMELGVNVTYGDLAAFVPVQRTCVEGDPAFASVRDGVMVGLTLAPGITYRFATPKDASIAWSQGDASASIPLLGQPEAKVHAIGPVVSQKVGRLRLVHPLAGGMPYYVVDSAPETAILLPADPVSAPVPKEVRVEATAAGDMRIQKGTDAAWTRMLPAGAVRVWSPLFQRVTGLHSGHPAFRSVESADLEDGFVPSGEAPVELEPDRKLQLEQPLGDFRVQLERAWQLQLGPDPKLEVVFEGLAHGRPVKGVIDPREGSGAIDVFVFENTATAPEEVMVFRHQGRTYFGWKTEDHLEALHFDGRGLLRSWTDP